MYQSTQPILSVFFSQLRLFILSALSAISLCQQLSLHYLTEVCLPYNVAAKTWPDARPNAAVVLKQYDKWPIEMLS